MADTLYTQLGGEVGVRSLVDRFYDLMDSLTEAAEIRALHPEDLSESREKLFLFLTGWFGGPALYVEKYGHPRLRARHLPFSIGIKERDQWMLCMRTALQETSLSLLQKQHLEGSFSQLADHMRNREE